MAIKKIAVVGGGPAGMMAAIRAGELNQNVTLFEKNPSLGKKLLLSGKGRCNFTNLCDLESFLKRFSKNSQFLRGAFKKFFNRKLMRFFEESGLRLKVERQSRVFPVTDKSDTILNVLKDQLYRKKVKIIYRSPVREIVIENSGAKGVLLYDGRVINAQRIILATGGLSFAFTGSTGEGLEMAGKLGHNIIRLRPGLVPLETKKEYLGILKGLTLKNIRLRFASGKKRAVSDIGELLFTHFGISGPLVLSLSGQIVDWLDENKEAFVEIDLKPALSEEQLDARLLREFKLNPRKTLKNILKNLLPAKLADVFVNILKISPDKKSSHVSQKERRSLIALLKGWRLEVTKSRPLGEAMVTRGGVCLRDINPATMESRIIKGLYFAGEIIDVDADTGGFNLQAAFSTGYLAGESASLN